jgi:hypothetical protein
VASRRATKSAAPEDPKAPRREFIIVAGPTKSTARRLTPRRAAPHSPSWEGVQAADPTKTWTDSRLGLAASHDTRRDPGAIPARDPANKVLRISFESVKPRGAISKGHPGLFAPEVKDGLSPSLQSELS